MRRLKHNIFFIYSITFLIILLIGLLPIEIKNRTFLFSGLFVDSENYDGLTQHILFMNDFVSHIKGVILGNESFSIYRFDMGLGNDFITSYTYYSLFDPLLIIAYIIPLKYIEFSYYLLIIIRLYLAGFFMIFLARKMGIKSKKGLLLVAILYCFSNSVTYSAFRHPMFTNGPMLLPLLILGAINLLENKRPYILIFTALYAFLAQFYIFVYLAFGFELFVLISLILNKEQRFSNKIISFIKVNLIFASGVLLAGVVLAPQLYATLFGGRISSKGFIWYPIKEYFLQFITYLVPLTSSRYTTSIGNFFSVFLCMAYNHKNKKKWYSYYLIVLMILLAIPLFGYAINGFSYVNNRWAFLMVLPVSLMVGDIYENKDGINESIFQKAGKTFIYFIIIILGLGLIYGISEISNHWLVLILSTIIVGILCYFGIIKIKNININNFKFKWLTKEFIFKGTLISSLSSLIIISLYYTHYLTPAYAFNKYYSNQDTYQEIRPTDDFYRVELNDYEANMKYFANDTIFYRLPSTSEYNTMTNGFINNFFTNLKVVNSNNSVGYNGFDGRTRLLALNNVKYYILREPDLIPYGFEYYTNIKVKAYDDLKKVFYKDTNILYESNEIVYKDAKVYVNTNFVNFGNTFTKMMLEDDFNKLHPLQKEMLLLDTIILQEDVGLNINNQIPQLDKQVVDSFELNNLELNNNTVIVQEGNGTIKFTINNIQNSEVFIEVLGIKNVDKLKTTAIYYQAQDTNTRQKIYAYGGNMYTDNSHHLVNLGYYENKESLEVMITFDKGTYTFDELSYYLVSIDDIKDKTNILNENSLTDVKLLSNGFTGKIKTQEESVLFISLPYSRGFSAYVNDQETTIYQANIGYMAIKLSAGINHIQFIYQTPGLKLGLIISIISAFGVIILVAGYEILSRKQNKS